MRLIIRKGSSQSKTHILLLFVVLFFSFILTNPEAKSQSTDTLLKSQKATSEKKDEIKNKKVIYRYNFRGKRDPFKPFISKPTVGKSKRKNEQFTPLQRYDLTQLKLTGIIWKDDKNISVAMVEDPEGKGYMLKKGTLIGENNGRVVNILKDRIIIREEFSNYPGNIKTRTTSIKLNKNEEGETP